jgi:hypothetical protein
VRCLKGQWEAVSIGPCRGDSNEAVSAKTGAVDLWLSGRLLVAFLGVGGDVHRPVFSQLHRVDELARGSMTIVAKCDKQCELQ